MNSFKYHYVKVLKQDFLTKFNYENSLQIPSLKKTVLSFGVTPSTLRNLLPSLGALFLVSSQKPCLVACKRPNLTLKFKGGAAIGCKLDLRGKDQFLFFEKLVLCILPRLKNFHYTVANNNVFFKIDNLFLFKEIEKEYDYFQDLSDLSVNLTFKAQTSQEVLVFLHALKWPLVS